MCREIDWIAKSLEDASQIIQIVQTLLELAEQVESNNISGSDARDPVEQVIEPGCMLCRHRFTH